MPKSLEDEVKLTLEDLKWEVKYPDISLEHKDILLLKGNRLLSGTVIHAYGMLVQAFSSSDVCILDPFLYRTILDGKKKNIEAGKFDVTLKFTNKV